jgi:hypothetical protein
VRRRRFVQKVVALAVPVGAVARVVARAAAEAASVGALVAPAAAPGFHLRLARTERPAGWRGGFGGGGVLVVCVAAGELEVEIGAGTAAVRRSGGDDPALFVPRAAVALLRAGEAAALTAGDCLAADADAGPTELALHNPKQEPAEVWEAGLVPVPLARGSPCGQGSAPVGGGGHPGSPR